MMQDMKNGKIYKRIVTFKQIDLLTWVVFEQRLHRESNTMFFIGEQTFDNVGAALNHFDVCCDKETI